MHCISKPPCPPCWHYERVLQQQCATWLAGAVKVNQQPCGLTLPSLLALCEARTQRFLMLLEGATLASRNCTVQLRTRVSTLPCMQA